MRIEKISQNRIINFTASENKKTSYGERNDNFGTKEVLLSLAGLAIVGMAGYKLISGRGNPSKTNVVSSETLGGGEESKELFKNVDIESFNIEKLFDKFKGLKDKTVTQLKGDRTKVVYSGLDESGNQLVDCVVFDKDKNMILRFLKKENKETGKMTIVSYSGEKKLSDEVQDFERADLSGYEWKKIFTRSELIPVKANEYKHYEQYAKVLKPDESVRNHEIFYNSEKFRTNYNYNNLKDFNLNYKFSE